MSELREEESNLLGVSVTPAVAIRQRALLVRTPAATSCGTLGLLHVELPHLIPLERAVGDIARRAERFTLDRIYGG